MGLAEKKREKKKEEDETDDARLLDKKIKEKREQGFVAINTKCVQYNDESAFLLLRLFFLIMCVCKKIG